MTNKEIMELFKIRPTREEGHDYIITIGNHLATEKHFEKVEYAENYIDAKEWDLIFALIAEMIEAHEQNKNEKINKEKEHYETDNN